MTPEQKEKIKENISYSLLKIYCLMKAASHEVDFIKEYKSLLDNKELEEVLKQSFPKIKFFNKFIESTFLKENVKESYLAQNEELTYQILEFIETKLEEIE